MPNINDELTTPMLTGYARGILATAFPDLGVLDPLFPEEERLDNKWKWDTTVLKDEPAVTYRAADTELVIGDRQGVSEAEVDLPAFGKKKILTEEHKIKLNSILNGTGNHREIIRETYDDIKNLIRGVRNRQLIDKGKLLSNGQLRVAGEVLNPTGPVRAFIVDVDYGVPSSQMVTFATPWTTVASADPFNDVLGLERTYFDNNNGATVGEWLINRTIEGLLLRNEAFRTAVYGPAVTYAPTTVSLQQINQFMLSRGLAPFRVVSAKATDEYGTKGDVLDQNKIIGIPEGGGLANMAIGTTAESLGMVEKGTIALEEAPGIVALVRNTDDPPVTFNAVTGYGMPVLQNPQLLVTGTVKS